MCSDSIFNTSSYTWTKCLQMADDPWPSLDAHHFLDPRLFFSQWHWHIETCQVRMKTSWLETHARCIWRGHGSRHMLDVHWDVMAWDICYLHMRRSWLKTHVRCTWRGHGSRRILDSQEAVSDPSMGLESLHSYPFMKRWHVELNTI